MLIGQLAEADTAGVSQSATMMVTVAAGPLSAAVGVPEITPIAVFSDNLTQTTA
jgi:hypothetical protein